MPAKFDTKKISIGAPVKKYQFEGAWVLHFPPLPMTVFILC
jgi:hypothetical protein